jgi:hypothetical protein
MFGHGQVEGLAEKYGMEYRRAYWDEQPDDALVARHEREILSLLHRRSLFAEVENFLLYDFFTTDGSVNEDLFAYSNRQGDHRALVIYHNKFATARGWIRTSAAYLARTGPGDSRALAQKSLGEGLGLRHDANAFCIFRDHVTGLEYIRSSEDLCENGLYAELDAYKCHVFLDWREVQDDEWHRYADLNTYLNGRGVPSIEEALREVFLQPIHRPFRDLVNAGALRELMAQRVIDLEQAPDLLPILDQVEHKALLLLREARLFAAGMGDETAIAREIRHKLEAILQLPVLGERLPVPHSDSVKAAADMVQARLADDPVAWGTLLAWLFTHALGKVVTDADFAAQSRSWMDEWLLGKLVAGALRELGLDDAAAWWAVGTAKILISHQGWYQLEASEERPAYPILVSWLKDSDVQQFLGVNRFRGILWFNKESLDQLLGWMLTLAAVEISAAPALAAEEMAREIAASYEVVLALQKAEAASEYQVVKLMEAAQGVQFAAPPIA